MPPKRYGRKRYGRGVNRRGTKYSFLKRGRAGGSRRSRFTRKRRVGVVRRKGRRRHTRKRKTRKGGKVSFPKYGNATPTGLQRKIAIANGKIWIVRRQVQCEWQVPPATTSSGVENYEPSIYCYPRKQDVAMSLENNTMTYPLDNADLFSICQQSMSLSATGLDAYQSFLLLKYKAKYIIRNQSNYAVRYQVLKFKVKRNIPYVAYEDPVTKQQSWRNPFNVAGDWLHRTGEASSPGIADASHNSLHKINCEVEKIPPFRHMFSIKKKYFKLSPGQTKAFSLTGFKQFKKIDLVGMEVELNDAINVKNDHWAGSQFLVFKMMSDPADWNATETNIWFSKSTRTVPTCLLSYQIEYHIRQPQTNHNNSIAIVQLSNWGFADNDDSSKVQNMCNADDQKIAEVDVV